MLPGGRNFFSRFFHTRHQEHNLRFKEKKVPLKSVLIYGTSTLFLWYNSELDHMTGRRKLNILSEGNRELAANILLQTFFSPIKVQHPDQRAKYQNLSNKERLVDATMALHLEGKHINPNHPGYERLARISKRLSISNPDTILDPTIFHLSQEGLLDAYSMANHIVFSVRTLDLWTDDQMAFIIAHEISHHLLDHHMENVSWMFVEMVVTLGLFFTAPSKILFAFGWLLFKPFKLLVTYPIKRQGEFDADDAGFKMMTKAGYDQREALHFWDKLERLNPSIRGFQYLRDHPNHVDRKLRMEENIKSKS